MKTEASPPSLPETEMQVENDSDIPITALSLTLSPEQEAFIDAVLNGPRDEHILLLGKAGVGKSTTTRELTNRADLAGLNYLKCAPTGVAAINIGGMTVHRAINFFNRNRAPLDFVLIDEASMARADLVDDLNRAMKACYLSDEPFGGVKLAFVGDPGQLPPVLKTGKNKDAESEFVIDNYLTPFFWSSNAYVTIHRAGKVKVMELTTVFRQKDERFPKLLNLIRKGDWNKPCSWLNKFRATNIPKGVVLVGTNADAQTMNEQQLRRLTTPKIRFQAQIIGDIKANEYPTEELVMCCVGARVMIIKNIYREVPPVPGSMTKQYELELVNGDVGIVTECDDERICVDIERTKQNHQVWFGDGHWEKEEKTYDKVKKRIVREVIGTFTQMPIRLAWALTIHKSQGATIDELTLDVRRPLFSAGQCYVALSRGVSLDRVHIVGTLRPRDVQVDPNVVAFLTDYQAGVGIKPGSIFDGSQLELGIEVSKNSVPFDVFDE